MALTGSCRTCQFILVVSLYLTGALFIDDGGWKVQVHQEELSEEKELTRAQKKNARKKQKKKEKKAMEFAFEIEEVTGGLEQVSLSSKDQASSDMKLKDGDLHKQPEPLPVAEMKSQAPRDGDVLRRIRAVRKKLKQIEELESRIASGDIQKPDQDQLSKIAKKEGFLDELTELMEES